MWREESLEIRITWFLLARGSFHLEPVFAEIFPFRIDQFHKSVFLFPPPAFYFFFSGNCVGNVFEGLEIDQPMAFVFPGKSVHQIILMLIHSLIEMGRDTRVKRAS
jgi:hypothetical protein